MSYTNNWVHGIRQTLTEGHTKQELEKLSNEKLKDLHKEYSGKDDDESKKEADMIKDILATRGDAGENKEEVKEAIEQLGEAKRRPKVEPIGGNTAPYGYHERVSPSGRKRYIPKTEEEWKAESAAFHKNNPNHWQNVERFQRENPLNPVRDQQYTGVDDHLPGGGAAALARSRAAFARPLPRKVKTRGDAGEDKEEEVKEAVRIGNPNYAAGVFAGAAARLTGHEKARWALNKRKAEEAEEAKKQKKETEETPSKTVSESKIKDTVKKLVKKGKKVATNVGKTLIDDRKSNYLSRDIKY